MTLFGRVPLRCVNSRFIWIDLQVLSHGPSAHQTPSKHHRAIDPLNTRQYDAITPDTSVYDDCVKTPYSIAAVPVWIEWIPEYPVSMPEIVKNIPGVDTGRRIDSPDSDSVSSKINEEMDQNSLGYIHDPTIESYRNSGTCEVFSKGIFCLFSEEA